MRQQLAVSPPTSSSPPTDTTATASASQTSATTAKPTPSALFPVSRGKRYGRSVRFRRGGCDETRTAATAAVPHRALAPATAITAATFAATTRRRDAHQHRLRGQLTFDGQLRHAYLGRRGRRLLSLYADDGAAFSSRRGSRHLRDSHKPDAETGGAGF